VVKVEAESPTLFFEPGFARVLGEDPLFPLWTWAVPWYLAGTRWIRPGPIIKGLGVLARTTLGDKAWALAAAAGNDLIGMAGVCACPNWTEPHRGDIGKDSLSNRKPVVVNFPDRIAGTCAEASGLRGHFHLRQRPDFEDSLMSQLELLPSAQGIGRLNARRE
jgi:hypothetical protein